MNHYTAFALIDSENKANKVSSSLEGMNPSPIGVGVMKIEDGSGFWEVSGFFSGRPSVIELKILEVVYEINFVVSKIVDKDWISQVQRELKPVSAGKFLVFGDHDKKHVPLNVCGLKIEAAMAFGTGHHATTVGCLLALDHLIKRGNSFLNIADIGCGTGVLAMAAANVSQANVIATDVDEVAVETAKFNFKANGLSAKIRLVQSRGFNNLEILKRAPFDLIFANILANPLCLLAPSIAAHTKKNASIILSGILTRQANRVERYYNAHLFKRVLIRRIDQWTTIIMQRK